MAEKKMIWKQQPGVDYTRKADALIGAVCRYLNTSNGYPAIECIAAILGIEQVEEKPEEPAEEQKIMYFGDNPIQE